MSDAPVSEIRLDQFSFRYRKSDAIALDQVSLAITRGESVVVSGPNDAGKSTLLLSLCGAIPHFVEGDRAGTVLIDGIPSVDFPLDRIARQFGVVLQDFDAQLFLPTVEATVAFPMENLGLSSAEIDERVGRALAVVDAVPLRYRATKTLSGGERQRVVLASVLGLEPPVLLLDEPTSQLDSAGTAEVMALLGRLHAERGFTIVLATHEIEAAIPHATRLLIVERGRIVADGRPRELFEARLFREVVRYPAVADLALGLRDRGIACPSIPLKLDEGKLLLGQLLNRGVQ